MADIDKVKKALKVVIDATEGVDNALEDGKLSLSELLSIVVAGVPEGVSIWGSRDELVAELKDLDKVEVEELEDFFEAEFDIRNDEAEEVVEAAIALLISAIDLILAVKALKESKIEE